MKRERLLELVNGLARHRDKFRGNDAGLYHRAWMLATTSRGEEVAFSEEERLEQMFKERSRRQKVKDGETGNEPETTLEQ